MNEENHLWELVRFFISFYIFLDVHTYIFMYIETRWKIVYAVRNLGNTEGEEKEEAGRGVGGSTTTVRQTHKIQWYGKRFLVPRQMDFKQRHKVCLAALVDAQRSKKLAGTGM